MKGGEEGGEEKEVVSLETLSKKMDDFAKARDWEKYHSPRNLLLAMVSFYSIYFDLSLKSQISLLIANCPVSNYLVT